MHFKHRQPKKYLQRATKPKKKVGQVILVGLFTTGILLTFWGLAKTLKNRSAASVISKITGAPALKATNGQTNILVLGLDRRGRQSTESGQLTDTIMVGSIGETGAKAFMVSLPRDL